MGINYDENNDDDDNDDDDDDDDDDDYGVFTQKNLFCRRIILEALLK